VLRPVAGRNFEAAEVERTEALALDVNARCILKESMNKDR
jgi:hypothetical protein